MGGRRKEYALGVDGGGQLALRTEGKVGAWVGAWQKAAHAPDYSFPL